MKVQYISNTGLDTVLALIKKHSKNCDVFYVAVGFITTSGLYEIINSLKNASNTGIVKVLTGCYMGVTQPQALKDLLKESNSRPMKFLSFLYKYVYEFHKKLYLFKKGNTFYAIVGSSNVTKIGLTNEGEGNLFITGSLLDPNDILVFNDMLKDFSIERSEQLDMELIKNYEKERKKNASIIFRNPQINIKNIFPKTNNKKSNKLTTNNGQNYKIKYYIEYLKGKFNRKTNAILESETNWDYKGWSCYAAKYSKGLKVDDIIFIIDATFKRPRIYRIKFKDHCHTKIETPDGRDFVAYKQILGYKIITPAIKSTLRRVGITYKSFKGNSEIREVSDEMINVLNSILRKN